MFESGSNKWRTFDSWPPKNATTKSLYFQPNGKLAFTPPHGDERLAVDSYVSDPAHPVPYRKRPIEPTYYPKGSGWYTWLLEDQRFVQRPAGRAELGDGAADGGRRRRRRDHGEAVRAARQAATRTGW